MYNKRVKTLGFPNRLDAQVPISIPRDWFTPYLKVLILCTERALVDNSTSARGLAYLIICALGLGGLLCCRVQTLFALQTII